MVFAAGSVGMRMRLRYGRWHHGLPRQDDMARFMLFGQVGGDLRMVDADIADETAQEPL